MYFNNKFSCDVSTGKQCYVHAGGPTSFYHFQCINMGAVVHLYR